MVVVVAGAREAEDGVGAVTVVQEAGRERMVAVNVVAVATVTADAAAEPEV